MSFTEPDSQNVEFPYDNLESGRSSSIILRLILHLGEHFYVVQNLEYPDH